MPVQASTSCSNLKRNNLSTSVQNAISQQTHRQLTPISIRHILPSEQNKTWRSPLESRFRDSSGSTRLLSRSLLSLPIALVASEVLLLIANLILLLDPLTVRSNSIRSILSLADTRGMPPRVALVTLDDQEVVVVRVTNTVSCTRRF